ncbi:MAG: metallophosphoesterase family protein [Pirellulaceae bacterium]
MKRVAVIYDIHGNLPALEAVLEEIRGGSFDRVVIGGDVLPGPMPIETIEALLGLAVPTTFILGNGDREVMSRMLGIETDWYRSAPESWRLPVQWSADQLGSKHQQLIASWPASCQFVIEGLGEVFFCHATPRNDTDIFTPLTPAKYLTPIFQPLNVPIVVCGHTHIQFDHQIGSMRILNAGSVGMPIGNAAAYWLALGPNVELRQTSYDFARAAERIKATTYPQAEQFAEHSVLRPPSEQAALANYQRVELGAA